MIEVLTGIVSGIVSGLGMGGGTILILIFTIFLNIEQHIAQATNLIFFIPTAIIAIYINKKQKLLDISFNKSNMSNLDKENFDTFNANLYSDDVDIAKYKFNISPRTNILNIKQKCIEFVENFDNPDSKNLLFTGNTGLRKDFYV